MGYLTNFIVYTLAMVGVIMLAVLVFKTTTSVNTKNGSKFLKVHDTLSLGPRKTLYIVSAGEEKFLIAGDIDKTSLISKLNVNSEKIEQTSFSRERSIDDINHSNSIDNTTFKSVLSNLPSKSSYTDKSSIGIYKTQSKPYSSVMKNLAERIKQ